MPIRNENTAHSGAQRKPLERLSQLALTYLAAGAEEKKIKANKEKLKPEIKKLVTTEGVYEMNGRHKEVKLPAGDGKSEVLVQLQIAETVSTVDDIIGQLRNKIGDEADKFIMKVEVLHQDALEILFNSGKITKQDLLDWTVTKEQERLIIKIISDKDASS